MRRNTIAGLCLIVSLGIGATAASSDAAKSALVFKTAEGPITPGSELIWSSPAVTLTMFEKGEGPEGSARLAKGTIKVVTTPMGGSTGVSVAAKPTRVEGGFTEVNFGVGEGTGFGPEPVNVVVAAKGLPWSYEFTSSGAVTIRGTKRVGLEFEVEGGETECLYETGKIVSSFEVGGVIQVKTSNQLFKKAAKKGAKKSAKKSACPKDASLEATFGLTSNGLAVESEVR